MQKPRLTPTGMWELCISNKKLMGKLRRWLSFSTEEAAIEYGQTAEKMLKAGIVPPELLSAAVKKSAKSRGESLRTILEQWKDSGNPARTDLVVLDLLIARIGDTALSDFTYQWSEQWMADMKMVANLTPGSIRKRRASLSRAVDWWVKRPGNENKLMNPLHLLPRGSASYNPKDIKAVKALGKKVKVDVERERRLPAEEEARIWRALGGYKRPDKERALPVEGRDAMALHFHVAIDTGMRMKEIFTLRRRNVNLPAKKLVFQSSKQWHGKQSKVREVPLKQTLHAALAAHLAAHPGQPDDPVFPFWDGTDDPEVYEKVGAALGARFRSLFAYAEVSGLTEHDLRHEATCRWFELRRPDGNWLFRESQIHKIMGWTPGSKMALRYASFRAEDMAEALWESGQDGIGTTPA